MGENQERRQARRQKRGVLRVEEILQAAGALFAEVGYDKVTTNMIAARAGVSRGSLYQFFPNKEAIAQAFATDATNHLQEVYDALLSSEAMTLPLQAFLDGEIYSDHNQAERNCVIALLQDDPAVVKQSCR